MGSDPVLESGRSGMSALRESMAQKSMPRLGGGSSSKRSSAGGGGAGDGGAPDPELLEKALTVVGEMFAVGILVMSARGALLFTTTRGQRLVGARAAVAPSRLQELARQLTDGADSEVVARITLPGSHHFINARVTRLFLRAALLVTLEEEAPRASLSKKLAEQFGLSARSIKLVQLASRGLKNREIAERLGLSEPTVKSYMSVLFRELGVRNRAELVVLAERLAAKSSNDDA